MGQEPKTNYVQVEFTAAGGTTLGIIMPAEDVDALRSHFASIHKDGIMQSEKLARNINSIIGKCLAANPDGTMYLQDRSILIRLDLMLGMTVTNLDIPIVSAGNHKITEKPVATADKVGSHSWIWHPVSKEHTCRKCDLVISDDMRNSGSYTKECNG